MSIRKYCEGTDCPLADSCLRYTDVPKFPEGVDFFDHVPYDKKNDICKYYEPDDYDFTAAIAGLD